MGRSLAFDAAKGRLWAVCPKCARWNLAPIEERWEAIEAGERLFQGTTQRTENGNIGLARLRDGTRLVRVGSAVQRELAAWRYGRRMVRRPLVSPNTALWAVYGAMVSAFFVPVMLPVMGASFAALAFARRKIGQRVVHVVRDETGARRIIRYEDLGGTWLSHPDDGRGVQLLLPYLYQGPGDDWIRSAAALRGEEAHAALRRIVVQANTRRAPDSVVRDGLDMVTRAGSPEELVQHLARQKVVLGAGWSMGSSTRASLTETDATAGCSDRRIPPAARLALEMALHEETERRALDGELSMLTAMWREAEEIASIADRLPDHLPPAEPPRV
ncbi:MAG TPA: hypothetical protein VK358_10615 [Longimicrobium sp.]|nr:hypothetical protein [Longimicrobium sp.]